MLVSAAFGQRGRIELRLTSRRRDQQVGHRHAPTRAPKASVSRTRRQPRLLTSVLSESAVGACAPQSVQYEAAFAPPSPDPSSEPNRGARVNP
jgi:hypothetical protein